MAEQNKDAAANPYVAPAGNGEKPAGQGPTPRKLAGKYDSVEEFERGHENLQHTLTERSQQLQQAIERIGQLEQMVTTVAERMSPADRADKRSSRARQLLEAAGIPVEAMEEFIAERDTTALPKAVESFMAPFTQGARAQEMLASEFPGVKSQDVNDFLNANPEVKSRYEQKYKSSPSEALYFAYAQYAIHRPESSDLSGQARARMDAQLPGNRGGNPVPNDAANDVAAGWDKFQNTGNVMDFLRPRLAHIVGKTTE